MSTIIDNHDRQFTFTDILSVNRKDKEYTHIRKVIYEYIRNAENETEIMFLFCHEANSSQASHCRPPEKILVREFH